MTIEEIIGIHHHQTAGRNTGRTGDIVDRGGDQEKTLLLYYIKPSWLLVTQEGREGDNICKELF
jgi:hypothetical protein